MFHNPIFPLGAADMRVELNKKSLFALASDTRLDILRSLQPMRRTVSQLAEALQIDKAAVYRHLKKMEEGELVKKYEDHGFVYYGLTSKARDLMSPNENTRIVILLSSTWIFVAAVVVMLLFAFASQGLGGTSRTQPTSDYEHYSLGPLAAESAGIALIWILLLSIFAILAVACAGLLTRSLKRPKQRSPAPSRFSEGEVAQVSGPLD